MTELARRMGWTKDRLSRLETGQRGLLAEDYERLMQALNVHHPAAAPEARRNAMRWSGIAAQPGRRMGEAPHPNKGELIGERDAEVIVDWRDVDLHDGSTYVARYDDGEWTVRGRVIAIGKRL